MVQWWIERLRDRQGDQAEALRIVAAAAQGEFRQSMAEYDAFVDPARAIRVGILLCAARSSADEAIPIRLARGEEHVHWGIQGGTGTGKTTWVASVLGQELEASRPF